MSQRRSLIALLAVGSAAAAVSCGSTNEAALTPSTTTAASRGASADGGPSPTEEDEDGGVRDDRDHPHARVLLVRGGDVTFIGLAPQALRCRQNDADAGRGCPDTVRFSGSIIIRGAQMVLLPRHLAGDVDGGVTGDGGVVGVPDGGIAGGSDGGTVGVPLGSRDALVLSRNSRLLLPGLETGDGGVPAGGADAGSVAAGSARLHGGRILVTIGGGSGGDAGVIEDGGTAGSGGRILHHIRDVRFEQSTLHFEGRPTENPDGG